MSVENIIGISSMLNQHTAREAVLPNFFIVGAPKAGTTSLYYYLDQHPDIFMSPVKEPHYFAEEIRIGNIGPRWQDWARQEDALLQLYLRGPMKEKQFGGIVTNWTDYLKLFKNVNGEKAVGEASVCYLWSKTAADNIASAVPGAKIIMMLRDPIDRAFSQYKQAVVRGLIGTSFREQLRKRIYNKSDQFELMNPFLEFGLYSEQVKRYITRFPRENLRIYLYEEYKQHPTSIISDIFSFLTVNSQFSPDMSERHLEPTLPKFKWLTFTLKKYGAWSALKTIVPHDLVPTVKKWASRDKQTTLDRADRLSLQIYYREDVLRLSDLIERDLSRWLE